MSLPNHQLELLAPARDAAIGIEAINHGADAVYMGGPGFGARSNAGNTVQEIERLCQHAHRFGARIFVTLNTILRDDELEPARRMAWDLYHAGVDALIVQDMGLLELDLPPIQLHASTQTDIRSLEKARFLQDVGFSQIVLARELSLGQIQAIAAGLDAQRCALEFFVHGALCVAYSGLCNISHAHTGRSANRGDCSQACRLPYHVSDSQGRFVAHDSHVLSMKDNNQTDNMAALVAAGVRSFKIEGRYKDMAYVKNITAHYRQLLDQIMEERELAQDPKRPPLARASSGRTCFTFKPDPNQNFNREFTDYFVQGRKSDIGAFDSPKNPGQTIGWVTDVGSHWVELETSDPAVVLNNGDGLCYYDLQKELVGVAINRAESAGKHAPHRWRVFPKDPIASLRDLRKGRSINRNRDMAWVRQLERKSSDRRIPVWLELSDENGQLCFTLTDGDGHQACAKIALDFSALSHAQTSPQNHLEAHLCKLGTTIFNATHCAFNLSQAWFIPASILNGLRRDAVAALEAARAQAWQRLPRAKALVPAPRYPEDSLSYLANVFNAKAHQFYARHGVKLIAAAYESHQELGEVSLMITKHCVRFSLSLCPKQAKGITGVQGTVKAEPLMLVNGREKLLLKFDCKLCEMHVVGKIKNTVLKQAKEQPLTFYKAQPKAHAAH